MKTSKFRRRRNPTPDEEQDLYDIDFSYDSPDAKTMLAYFDWMSRRFPEFKVWRVDFTKSVWVIASSVKGEDSPDYIYEMDKDGTFSRKDAREYLSDIATFSRWDEYFDKDLEEEFNRQFWEYPSIVYHGTKSMSGIMRKGIEPRSESRGINNRSVGPAVFTSLDDGQAESYASDGMVAIDTPQMKLDGYMPWVAEEPEVLEQGAIGAIAHKLGIEYNEECSDSGISPDTVIFFGKIPAKYLKKL